MKKAILFFCNGLSILFVQVITRNIAGKEKYTFTVTNRDGIIGQVFLTLTVN